MLKADFTTEEGRDKFAKLVQATMHQFLRSVMPEDGYISNVTPPSIQPLHVNQETKEVSVMLMVTGTITHPIYQLKVPENFDEKVHEATTKGSVRLEDQLEG